MKRMKQSVPYLLVAVLIVVIDQIVKYWVRGNIPLYGGHTLVPGIMDLTYVQNSGAAFSILTEHTGILTVISAVAVLLITVLLVRGLFPDFMGRFSLCLVLGGAAGNLIDRALFGYVVDMFRPVFMNFAVFNVADIGVTCGGVLLCIYVLFFWQKATEKQEGEVL